MGLGLAERNQVLDERIRFHGGRGWRLYQRDDDSPRATMRRIVEVNSIGGGRLFASPDRRRVHELTITVDEDGRYSEVIERLG